MVTKRKCLAKGIESLVISLYAKGMSNADIEEQLREIYDFRLSPRVISRITGHISEDIVAWQNRPLEPVYLIVWMDGIVFKVRENSYESRGVMDILITATDNLNGFTDTIRNVFPGSRTQICVIHQIRNACRYVVWKDKKEFNRDMKQIYAAPTRQAAGAVLEDFARKWEGKYAYAVKS